MKENWNLDCIFAPAMNVELSGHYGYKRILITMFPMVVMMVVMSVYSIIDGVFVSNYVGSTAFAALNFVWPVIAMFAVFGIMIGTGGSALVSKTMGEGKQDEADRIFTMLVRLSLYVGIVLTLLLELSMRPLVLFLGAEGEMVQMSVMYGRIMSAALPFQILQMEFQSFYMAAEKPQLGTFISIVSGILNVVLDFFFIVVFGWGLAGAAVATAIAIAFGGIYPIVRFSSSDNGTRLHFVKGARMNGRYIVKTCTNGLSEFVGNVSLSIVSICYNVQLMKYIGENGVSAYGIIMYIAFIFGSVFIGYNMGISQIVAYNYGADNKFEMRSLLNKSLVIISLTGLLICVVSELSSGVLARVFVGYDAELVSITRRAVRIYMLCFLICGINMFCSAWFTALNNGIVSAIAAFARTLVFELTSIFVLPLFFGIDGIWMSVNAAEIASAIVAVSLFLGFRRRYGY